MMKIKAVVISCFLSFMVIICLLFTGCATKKNMTEHAKVYQKFSVEHHWTEEVGRNPDMASWQTRIATEGWTEEVTDDLIDYLQKLMLYAPIGKCGSVHGTCSPGMFQEHNYTGLCSSCGSYIYHTFKYLKYPRGVRIGWVSVFGLGHQIVRLERPDGTWRLVNSYNACGLHYLDELFYIKLVDFDDDGIY